jgi:hypothetical protein
MIEKLAMKINQLIEASNEQAERIEIVEKKIDFIMGKEDKYDGSEHIKHHTEDRCVDWCPNCSKQLVDYSYHKQCNNCDYKFIKE